MRVLAVQVPDGIWPVVKEEGRPGRWARLIEGHWQLAATPVRYVKYMNLHVT